MLPTEADVELSTIGHGSPEYRAAVALRTAVLRQPIGLAFSDEELTAEFDSHHVGCWAGGRLVGCLVLQPIDADRIRMRQVAVEPAARGAGIGRRMVRHAERLAHELGFREMVLHARENVVPFYERLGYAGRGAPFLEITIPHRVMGKAL
jgi:predicted GNAT family N-acyltransferase